jgi:selenocysteine-specific elongation factor
MRTIGGGTVLDAKPAKHRRFRTDVIDSLKVKDEGQTDELLLDFMQNKQEPLSTLAELAGYLGQATDEVATLLDKLATENKVIHLSGGQYLNAARLNDIQADILGILHQYHKQHRLRVGMPIEEFRSRLRSHYADGDVAPMLQLLTENGTIRVTKETVAAGDFTITFNKYQLAAKDAILHTLAKSSYMPVKADELAALDKNAGEVLEALAGTEVVFLTHEYVLLLSIYEKAQALVRQFIGEHGEMTLADFRDMTDSSRKASMMILEYMDKTGLTRRVENKRVLNK